MARGADDRKPDNGAHKLSQGLDFERPILELEQKIEELQTLSATTGMDLNGEITPLKERCARLLRETFAGLDPWQQVAVARHPQRPLVTDYLTMIVDDSLELFGDRSFADDKAILTALARIGEERVLLVGHRKGKSTREKIACNFGCAHPEGYRKAFGKMKLAEKFGVPIVTLIDTPGAYPGIGAEERGQAHAIARNILEMSRLRTPIVSIVTGEGGSGGALGIGVGDIVAVLEHAYYSVISPEGCAAILWKSGDKAQQAASALKLTARNLADRGIVDEVIPEPLGGAHRDPRRMGEILRGKILEYLQLLRQQPVNDLLEKRYKKFRAM